MSESQAQAGTGRARGRARGRAQPPPMGQVQESVQAMRISPTGSGDGDGGNGNGSGSNGNGNGNGNGGDGAAAVRGRGGYRGAQELDTRPQNVPRYYAEGSGKIVRVVTNYFRLNTPTDVVFNNYHVEFEPSIEAIKLRRQMVYGLKGTLFGGESFLFDGMSNVKAMVSKREPFSHVVPNPAVPDQMVKIDFKWTEEVPWGSAEMMRFYNTQMRRNLQHLEYILMGRNYFDKNSKKSLPEHQIQLLQGVVTAINQHDGGLLMVVDTATKFIRDETVLRVMMEIRKQAGAQWLDEAKKQICGQIIMTKYNNRTYRVDDILTDKNVNDYRFEKGGQSMTMMEYYKQHWNINIAQPGQPLISCLPSQRDRRAGRTDPIYLVPELCQLTGLTDQMRNDFNLMKKIGDISRLAPDARRNNLNEFLRKLCQNQQVAQEMKEYRLEFDKRLVEVEAREMVGERIYMGNDDDNSAATFDQKSGDFSREMRSKRLHGVVSLTKWVVITTNRMSSFVDEFLTTIRKAANPMGISLGQPKVDILTDDRAGSFVNKIQTYKNTPCEMVVTLVPNNNSERYSAIKKCCYVDCALPSQVVVQRTLNNKQRLMSVCTKIIIQMATKLGGEPWALKIPPKGLVVIGYDTYHDSMDRNRSVGGFVCSLNQTLTSWYSRVAFHKKDGKDEMSSNFAHNLAEGMKRWFQNNGNTLPKKIIVYRDGVSEGMIKHVYEFELKQIQNVLDKMFGQQAPPFAFVIVTKRVNARFFTPVGQNLANPIPGTVIDKVVTRSMRYDFYLISQSVRQGTVTPTMYNIIHDESGFQPHHHQQLAYKLCHLYYNWPGTIRVPAPCQYAHKLAYLTGTSLHREPHDRLSDRLFYL